MGGRSPRHRGGCKLQWGHRFSSVERPRSRPPNTPSVRCFNGATDFHRWKYLQRGVGPPILEVELQWGHRFSSVEIIRAMMKVARESAASMGPPIFIGGNNRRVPVGVHQNLASMGPPIFIGGNIVCVLRHAHCPLASMGPPIFIGGNNGRISDSWNAAYCFNGATDFHRWKSPGPRGSSSRFPCFNGATDFHRWKWGLRGTGRVSSASFNGATDFHRWKLLVLRVLLDNLPVLQWGHRFSSVEIWRLTVWPGVASMASMGPPIFIGGNSQMRT